MHPILSRADRAWLVYLLFGVAAGFALAVPLRDAGAGPLEVSLFGGWCLVLLFLALRSWAIARYVTLTGSAFIRVVMTMLAASVLISGVWLGVGYGIAIAFGGMLPAFAPAIADRAPSIWPIAAVMFLCTLLLIYALDAADQGEAAARRALESDVASRDAELRALRAQVDPHFLFNCLHSISSLTARDPQAARRMCLELAEFFRASLRAGAEQRITLHAELQLLRNYLNIEQVRFGARLRARVDEAGDARDVTVPPLLLQPLVENAVRHGIATLIDGGDVHVRVTPGPDRVELAVENPFDPEGRRPGTGVGLTNVRDRLEASYRGAAKLRADTEPGDPSRFTVLISIPREDVRA